MSEPVGTDLDPAAEADRVRRADRATRGAMAAVLALEALVVLLVPRALAFTSTGLGAGRTVALIVLAVVMVLAAGMLRRPGGIGLGSVLQLLLLLTGLWLGVMWFLGAAFLAIWVRLAVLRRQLLGTPGGWRLLLS